MRPRQTERDYGVSDSNGCRNSLAMKSGITSVTIRKGDTKRRWVRCVKGVVSVAVVRICG